MTKLLLGAASALAMMAGSAFAQQAVLASNDFAVGFTDNGIAGASSPDLSGALSDRGIVGNADVATIGPLGELLSGSGAVDDEGNAALTGGVLTGNQGVLIQDGDNNDGFIIQEASISATDNQAVTIQNGFGNLSLTSQRDTRNEASTLQLGDFNLGVVLQDEIGGSGSWKADQSAALFQQGDVNTSVQIQRGDSNASATLEIGSFNSSAILQASSDNPNSNNTARRNSAVAVQDGDFNTSFISQNDNITNGNGLSGPSSYGDGAILLDGAPLAFGLFPGTATAQGVVAASITSIGNRSGSNVAAVVQRGIGNTAAMIQRGTGNVGAIIQVSALSPNT